VIFTPTPLAGAFLLEPEKETSIVEREGDELLKESVST